MYTNKHPKFHRNRTTLSTCGSHVYRRTDRQTDTWHNNNCTNSI